MTESTANAIRLGLAIGGAALGLGGIYLLWSSRPGGLGAIPGGKFAFPRGSVLLSEHDEFVRVQWANGTELLLDRDRSLWNDILAHLSPSDAAKLQRDGFLMVRLPWQLGMRLQKFKRTHGSR